MSSPRRSETNGAPIPVGQGGGTTNDDKEFPLGRSIGAQIRGTQRALSRALQAMLATHDIPVGMWYFLRVLWEEDGLSQREICSRAGATPPTGAEQLRNMENRGLILRHASKSDRRKVHFFLTPEGRSLEAKLMPLPQKLESRALDGITAGEAGFLRLALIRIQNNLEGFDLDQVNADLEDD